MADADFEKYDFDENLFQSPSRHHLVKMVRILIYDEDQNMNAFHDYIANGLFAR